MSTTYTRNPFNVEAVQYDGSNDSELRDFGITFTRTTDAFIVTVTAGSQPIAPGYYLFRRTDGRVMAMDEATFEADYTLTEEP